MTNTSSSFASAETLADIIILQKIEELYGPGAVDIAKVYDQDHTVMTKDMVAGEEALWKAAADEGVTEELYEAFHATTMDDLAEAYAAEDDHGRSVS